MPRSKKAGSFRARGTNFFLTYPRFPHRDGKNIIHDKIRAWASNVPGRTISAIVIGRERHNVADEEGARDYHHHVYVRFSRNVDISNPRAFDVSPEGEDLVFHCNIQPARDVEKIIRYVTKEDDDPLVSGLDLADFGTCKKDRKTLWDLVYDPSVPYSKIVDFVRHYANQTEKSSFMKLRSQILQWKQEDQIQLEESSIRRHQRDFNQFAYEIWDRINLAWNAEKTPWICGSPGSGKTSFTRSFFGSDQTPVRVIRNLNALRNVQIEKTSVLVLDDLDWRISHSDTSMTIENALNLIEPKDPWTVRCLYGDHTFVACKKIVISNFLPEFWDQLQNKQAYRRRVELIEINKDLREIQT